MIPTCEVPLYVSPVLLVGVKTITFFSPTLSALKDSPSFTPQTAFNVVFFCINNDSVYSFVSDSSILGYPPSTVTGHVSHKTNHQMLRNTTYSAKFAVAAFTDLGYELKLDELSPLELDGIKKQVEFYKAHRELLQFGNFYKVRDKYYPGDDASWLVLSHDKKEAIISYFKGVTTVHTKETFLKGFEFTEGKKYEVTVFGVEHDIKMFGSLINMILPIHVNPEGHIVSLVSRHKGMHSETESYIVDGSILNDGLLLKSEWSGTGFNENVRVMGDFGGRLYYIHQVD